MPEIGRVVPSTKGGWIVLADALRDRPPAGRTLPCRKPALQLRRAHELELQPVRTRHIRAAPVCRLRPPGGPIAHPAANDHPQTLNIATSRAWRRKRRGPRVADRRNLHRPPARPSTWNMYVNPAAVEVRFNTPAEPRSNQHHRPRSCYRSRPLTIDSQRQNHAGRTRGIHDVRRSGIVPTQQRLDATAQQKVTVISEKLYALFDPDQAGML